MNILSILIILFIHFIADTVAQDEKWATTKYKSVKSLVKHVSVYSLIWLFVLLIPFGLEIAVKFAIITFILHYFIDMISSNITHLYYIKGKFGNSIPNFGFFTVILFDQFLHYVSLFLTYEYLILK